MEAEDRQPVSLAEKLDHLFVVRSRERGRPVSANEVATALNIKAGEPVISGNYIWHLRRGKRDNPTKRHLEALAEYFGVPAAYFHDRQDPPSSVDSTDAARRMIDDDLLASRELDRSMAEAGVSAVYLRGDLAALSPEGKRMAADMIRQIRELEQIARNPPSPPEA
jgi:transcriptional regulator with XRE-family HTH domain